ncbi:MAG: hypothetical protein ABSE16_06665 [Verrucomicrobiota bacterium]|jgi:hypothetical protein
MEPISTTKTAVEGAGLLKDLYWAIAKTKDFFKKIRGDKIPDCGYIILYRKISAHYTKPTKGVLTHEIEIKATRDHQAHYYGRYLHRSGKAKLTIKSPHRGLSYDGIVTGFQKFTVQLRDPLAKNQTEKIVMDLEWEDEVQGQSPEVAMHILCPTHSLEFFAVPPDGTSMTHAEGQIGHHPGVFMPIKTELLTPTGGVLYWKTPPPKMKLTYRVSWNWA